MNSETIVIGGGLGGLAAATFLARAGVRVRLLEKATHLGGRAQSQTQRGCTLNLGPHALYKAGPAEAALRELGVPIEGGEPKASGGYALFQGALSTLPVGPFSLLTTGLLSLGGKLEVGKFLGRASRLDASTLLDTPLATWLDEGARVEDATGRALIEALARVTTYTNAPKSLSAGIMLAQLQRVSRHNVLYLDGGWQRLVDGVCAVAEAAGVAVESGVKVAAIEAPGGGASAVRLADGRVLPAANVVIAASPAVARALLPDDAAIAGFATRAVPVEASCLGVALDALPRPRATFLLGVDEPLYVSVHSAVAKVAPEGHALIEVARYLAPGERPATEAELVRALELLQPGATAHIVESRYLPRMTVAHDVARAAVGGLAARPRVDGASTQGVLLVGDWVGPTGLLADASFASAREAAELVIAASRGRAAGADLAGSAREAAVA